MLYINSSVYSHREEAWRVVAGINPFFSHALFMFIFQEIWLPYIPDAYLPNMHVCVCALTHET